MLVFGFGMESERLYSHFHFRWNLHEFLSLDAFYEVMPKELQHIGAVRGLRQCQFLVFAAKVVGNGNVGRALVFDIESSHIPHTLNVAAEKSVHRAEVFQPRHTDAFLVEVEF